MNAPSLTYYQALVRGLGPAGLMRAVARRAASHWRQAVAQPDWQHIAEVAARAVPGEALLIPRPIFSDVSRRASVRRALARVPGARERAMARAQTLLDGRVPIFGRNVRQALGGYDWTLAAAQGWSDGRDPKFPWALGRLDGLVWLGQGSWASGEPRFSRQCAEGAAALFDDFEAHNPPGEGVQWQSPMEVALRAANLALGVRYFADQPSWRDSRRLSRVIRSLAIHVADVERRLEDATMVPNNHLIANWVGLLTWAALVPEAPRSGLILRRAHAALGEQMAAQVHPDGLSFEGSLPYHRLSLELFTLAWLVAKSVRKPFDGAFHARLSAMFRMARDVVSDGGFAPQIGDNDSGRIVGCPERASLDFGYLAPLGAGLLRCASLKTASARAPDELIWLGGEEALNDFETLLPAGAKQSFVSHAGGVAVLHAPGALVAISGGPSGQRGVGGHSHNDKLGFELHLGGQAVIVDPGSPTYTGDARLRNELRSTAAHSTLQVNGAEQSPLSDSRLFALPDAAHAQMLSWQSGAQTERLVVTHSGFPGVRVERTFILEKVERALVVCDDVQGVGEADLVARLALPDELARIVPLTPGDVARAGAIASAPLSLSASVVELGPPDAPRARVLWDEALTPTLEPALYSPGYGESHAAKAVVVRAKTTLPARWTCLMLFETRAKNEVCTCA